MLFSSFRKRRYVSAGKTEKNSDTHGSSYTAAVSKPKELETSGQKELDREMPNQEKPDQEMSARKEPDQEALEQAHSPVVLPCAIATYSEIGRRFKNDDCALVEHASGALAISDGIGGAPDGDYMSRVACGAAVDAFEESHDLGQAFAAANKAAVRVSRWIRNAQCGATLLLACIDEQAMHFAWVGDTVAYRLRNGELERVTGLGRLSAESNALSAAVGYDEDLVPDFGECDIAPGDVFVLCTDGVWEPYEKALGLVAMRERIESRLSASSLARNLCQEAAANGSDNATAIAIVFDGDIAENGLGEERGNA